MLGGNHFDTEKNEDSVLARRPESASCNASDNEENPHLNTRENRSCNSTDRGQNSTGASSSAEFKDLSGERTLRISREMDEMMKNVSVQIQRAINDAISNQIFPQTQNASKAGSGQVTQKGWNVPAERPEKDAEDCRSERIRSNSKGELVRNLLNDDLADQAHDKNGRKKIPKGPHFLIFWHCATYRGLQKKSQKKIDKIFSQFFFIIST